MLKVEINLCIQEDGNYCSPVMRFTEEDSDKVCNLVLAEYMGIEEAKTTTETLEKIILETYETVEEVSKAIYG